MKNDRFKDDDFKTAMCGGQWGCVAVAMNQDFVAVRSTKDKDKTTVVFDHAEWSDFISAVQNGEFSVKTGSK